jgi:hypothetical protein
MHNSEGGFTQPHNPAPPIAFCCLILRKSPRLDRSIYKDFQHRPRGTSGGGTATEAMSTKASALVPARKLCGSEFVHDGRDPNMRGSATKRREFAPS